MLNVSIKTIEKHRWRIVGGVKIFGIWRFKLEDIKRTLEAGKNVIPTSKIK
jgi:hypothetical protein